MLLRSPSLFREGLGEGIWYRDQGLPPLLVAAQGSISVTSIVANVGDIVKMREESPGELQSPSSAQPHWSPSLFWEAYLQSNNLEQEGEQEGDKSWQLTFSAIASWAWHALFELRWCMEFTTLRLVAGKNGSLSI